VICDRALLTGYVRETETISPAVVRECARELTLPGESRGGTPEYGEGAEKRRSGLGRLLSRALLAALLAVLALLVYSLLVFGSWRGLWAGIREYSSRVQTRIEQYLGASRSQAHDREKYGKIPEAPAVSRPSPDAHSSPPPPEDSKSIAPLPNPARAKAAVD